MLTKWGLFPEQASTLAGRVDALYFFLIAVSTFFGLLIACLILAFAFRYRRRKENLEATQIEGSLALEGLWTLIPFCIAMVIFVWSASVYFAIARAPEDALEVFVVGKQWMWKLQHMEGRREINELHVPVGRPVKLTMTSEDVIHSFYVPAFRVKADVLPGRYTMVWFEPTKPGTYHLFCAEYCGTEHSQMIGKIVAMEPADYQAWLTVRDTSVKLGEGPVDMSGLPPAVRGAELFKRNGCTTCHAVTASDHPASMTGPPLYGVYGRRVSFEGGREAVADETYLRRSILDPTADVVRGFKPMMPTYKSRLSEEDVLALIAYIKSLAEEGQRSEPSPKPSAAGAPVPRDDDEPATDGPSADGGVTESL